MILPEQTPFVNETPALERLVRVPSDAPGEGFALLEGTRSAFRVSEALNRALSGEGGLDGDLRAKVAKEVQRLRNCGFWPAKPSVWELSERFVCLSLHLAHQCNLACPYCNVQQGTYGGPASRMGVKIARKGVNFLQSMARGRSPKLTFYGGEPLLNWDVLAEAVLEAERVLPGCGLEVITNGTLIDRERAEFLAAHGVFGVLSLDGPPEVHDRNRPMRGGGGSYEAARRGLGFLQEAGASFHIRATWVPGNGDYDQVLDHLAELAGDARKVSVALEFDRAGGQGVDALNRALCRQYRAEPDDLPAGLAPYLDQVLRADLAPVPRCEAGRAGFSVTPDGTLYPCQVSASLERFPLGTVETGLGEEGERNLEAFLKGPEAGCEACWARTFCSGPCVYSTPEPEERPFCRTIRLQLEEALERAARAETAELGSLPRTKDLERGMALRDLLWQENTLLRPLALYPQPDRAA